MHRKKYAAAFMAAALCLNIVQAQDPIWNLFTASAETLSDMPQDYRTACDWVWQNRIEPEGSCKGWSTIYDQIIAGKGTLNYLLIWQSYEPITLAQRQALPQILENAINQWNDCLVGYDDWPVEHVNVNVIGYAVLDKSVLPDLQPDEVVYTDTANPWTRDWLIESGMGNSSIPVLQPAEPTNLSRYAHWQNSNWSYNGSYDNRYDMYLHGIHGMIDMGGVGYHYGQILSDHAILGLINGTTSPHILLHEMGHGFGYPDYYGGEGASDGFPPGGFPGGQGSIMMAGSCAYINTFDRWFARYAWSKLKAESGRFDLSGFSAVTTDPPVTQTTTTVTTTTTTTVTQLQTAELTFTDTVADVQLSASGGTIRFENYGSFSFSGSAYYNWDESKNLANYEAGDRISIRFTYNVQTGEILQISELTLEQNVHTVRCDVDMNGAFEIADIVLVQQWLLQMPSVTLADWQAGDLNGDGKLNGTDLTLMKRAILYG